MSCVDLQYISSDECIGASLPKINGNFAALSAAVCELSSVPAVDASVNVVDSPTIDLNWNASTRTLSAVTTASVATSSSPMVAKAWVNFNGTNSTTLSGIRSSYNVSSITRNGNGDYTVNFANGTFSDTNYTVIAFGEPSNGSNLTIPVGSNTLNARTASSIRIVFYDSSAGVQNPLYANIVAF
jgi:hypothetical protein